jgi:hypothetical protein
MPERFEIDALLRTGLSQSPAERLDCQPLVVEPAQRHDACRDGGGPDDDDQGEKQQIF